MAGQIAELARDVLPREYRDVDTRKARVLLVEAGDRVLAALPRQASRERGAPAAVARRDAAARQHRDRRSTPTGSSSRLRRAHRGADRRSGRRASPPRRSRACLRTPRARRSTAPDASSSSPISPSRGIPRCSRSATWSRVRGAELHGVAPVAMQQGRHVARSIRAARAEAVRLQRQGRARDDRPCARGRARQRRSGDRLPRLGAVARDPHRRISSASRTA